jgi:hypothetical protein
MFGSMNRYFNVAYVHCSQLAMASKWFRLLFYGDVHCLSSNLIFVREIVY